MPVTRQWLPVEDGFGKQLVEAFHGLTDQMPPKVWIVIGRKDWRPRLTYPPVRIARFSDEQLAAVSNDRRSPARRCPCSELPRRWPTCSATVERWGDALAIEGLRQALRRRNATPAEIAREAEAAGVWDTMEPYVMAVISDA